MFCKLCGEHLYKNITFRNIFKSNYYIHEECENLLNKNSEYTTFPLLEKLVFLDYLFEEKYEESDSDFLFLKYGQYLIERMNVNKDWSVVMFVENEIDSETMMLIINLAEKAILLISVFNENIM
ncbi:hypothetical protein KQ51_00907 [Candidatus Izimaplasma bacterium HR1]|uniref:hypothetical protein n=1 Tax=Candidatus Izimoplasma sp. HR1 TaxID=1541959 RepID=UPI0004F605D4|nr:hypothetical protein KQ51_00907 [Candidatus Izimaplasma bacterium HR1]